MIDRLTIDKILDAANIVDVVSDFVTLKRSGANLKAFARSTMTAPRRSWSRRPRTSASVSHAE